VSRKDGDQMSGILVDPSTLALVAAIKTNQLEWFRHLASSPGAERYDGPDLRWWITGLPHHYPNGVQSGLLPPSKADEIVRNVVAHFALRHVPSFSWWGDPGIETTDLERHLVAHGFALREGPTGMAVNLLTLNEDIPAPPDLRIEPVAKTEALATWAHIATVGSEVPPSAESTMLALCAGAGFDLPMRSYLGVLKGEPVAISQLFLAAGVAGISLVATLREARRKGIGTAMTLAPLLEAREMGYRIGSLWASRMGLGVYHRLGFQDFCRLSSYRFESTVDSPESAAH
jgi:GNAT superfamily N-acetyltransferase